MFLSILYWLIPIFCFLVNEINCIKRNKKIKYLAVIIIVFFMCFSYLTGVDWYAYKIRYNGTCDIFEPIYNNLANYFYKIGINYWYFSYALKLIAFSLLYKILKIYPQGKWFIFGFLFCNKFFIMMMAPILRNLIAISILWGAVFYYHKKRKLLSLFLFLLSVGFHRSAIVIIILLGISSIFYFLPSIILHIFLIIAFIMAPQLGNIASIIIMATSDDPTNVSSYLQTTGIKYGGLTILNLPLILSIFLICIQKKEIVKLPMKSFVYNSAIMSILLIPFSMQIGVFYRIKMFFDLFWAISIYTAIKKIKLGGKLVRYFLLIIYIVTANILLSFEIVNRNNYIPYTNYFIDSSSIPSNERFYTEHHSPFK